MIFNHQDVSVFDLPDSILYLVDFWAGHLHLHLRSINCNVSVFTYARKSSRVPPPVVVVFSLLDATAGGLYVDS